ncbi:hypothetical protein LZC95_25815 [Pendulispora brunnea]|uniref:Uncharacterized protein n=1 Tax=Pendulispora brunnea TaxID=2905690 RepID=A0ABZ2JTT4_9BACT
MTPASHRSTPLYAALMAHPAVVASIGLLLLNDHVLKVHWSGLLTGKLSDAAGLTFFPVLLLAFAAVAFPWPLGLRALLGCTIVTAIAFAWVKIDPAGTAFYRHGLAVVQWPWWAAMRLAHGHGVPGLRPVVAVTDPSDALMLPFAGVSPFLAVRCGKWAARAHTVRG